MDPSILAQLLAADGKELPGWVAAWGGLALLAVWTSLRRLRGAGRLAPRGLWPVAAVVVLAFSGLVRFLVERSARHSDETLAWPTTQGRILQSRLRWNSPAIQFTSPAEGLGDGIHRAQYLDLRYQYEVDGARHMGTQVTRGQARIGRPDEEWARRFPAGKEVTVHYNPADPAEAVLETRAVDDRGRAVPTLLALFALGLVAFGLWERLLHGTSGPALWDE